MSALRLGIHTRVKWNDCILVVRSRIPSGHLQLMEEETGFLRNCTHAEIAEAIATGTASLQATPADLELDAKLARKLEADMAALPERDRKEGMRRAAYVWAVEKLPESGRRAEMSNMITEVAKKIGDDRPPGVSTVYRWFGEHTKASGDARALVPATRRRGNRARRYSDTVLDIVRQVINERYLIREQPSAREVHFAVVHRIAELNATLPPSEQVRAPKLKTFYREINRLDPYTVAVGRKGQRAADMLFGLKGPGPETNRPLQRVECDHTKLDLFVVDDESGLPIGRPWLTMLLDHHTRMPVGYYMGFIPPSFESVQLALRNAILPKTWLKERFPEIEGTWPCYGVPEAIVVDNGREFHSLDFETSCLLLGIEIQHMPIRSGWYKGSVERFFRTVNEQMLSGQPGRTLPVHIKAEDYDPARNAIISLGELERLTCKWITEVYGKTLHTGIEAIPLVRWEEGITKLQPRLPTDARELDVHLACTDKRCIVSRGIEIFYLHYRSEQLQGLRYRLPKGRKVHLRYNPGDLTRIYVLDPDSEQFFPVPIIPEEEEYASSVGLWQHRIITQHARRLAEGRVDIVALARAKEEIHARIAAARDERSKTGSRVRRARFEEGTGKVKREKAGKQSSRSLAASDRDDAVQWPKGLTPPPLLLPLDDDDDWDVSHELLDHRTQR